MKLALVEEAGLRLVEGPAGEPLLLRPQDAVGVVEACLSHRAHAAVLYACNLTAGFFDLSSGEAGDILQKLRNYRVPLVVVCPRGSVRFSSRFGEMEAEERRGEYFGTFDSREEALAWLAERAG